MKLEALLLIMKVAENILEIVQEEHPEIVTQAIIKTLRERETNA